MSVKTEYMPHKGDTVLIQELARGSKKVVAADRAGVHVNTIANRLRDPKFRKLVNEHRADFLSEVAGVLASSAVGAAITLQKLYRDPDEPAHVRRSAARDVLEYTIRIRELHEVETRLTTIEELLEKEQLSSVSSDR
jgi:hypothetical protein